MVIFLWARGTDWSTIPVLCLRFSDWPISIYNLAYIFHRVLSDPYSDILRSKECHTKKLLANMLYCKMFDFFKAIFNFINGTHTFIFRKKQVEDTCLLRL